VARPADVLPFAASFDASTFELWAPLVSAAPWYWPAGELEPAVLAQALTDHAVNACG